MSDLSNNDLDRLFQQGAESGDIPFKPEAWERMVALLRRDRRRRLLWFWLSGLAGVGLLILILFLLWPGKKTPENFKNLTPFPEQPGENRDATAPGHKPAALPAAPDKAGMEQPATPAPAITPAGSDKVDKTESVAPPARKESIRATSAGAPRPVASRVRVRPGSPALAPTPEARDAAQLGMSPVNTAAQTDVSEKEALPASSLPVTEAVTAPNRVAVPAFLASRLSLLKSSPHPLPDFSPGAPIQVEKAPNAGFRFGFNVAPEWSNIDLEQLGQLGFRAGLQTEWRYARHFSLGAGLFLSQKRYSAEKGYYTPPKGFWTRKIVPESVSGRCTVLEVPVFAGYYPRSHSSSGFFMEAGMSNFFLLREKYQYFYEIPDEDLIRHWGTQNQNRNWMGILTVQPGYQWILGHPWSIQVSPYVQIPLEGVGHGKVDLYSLGVNFRLNFNPSRPDNR